MKNTCITAYYAAWMAAALLHIWSIGMKSTGQEALESQVLWESTTGGLWTCKYLSHILTKTFLFSKHGGERELRKEMSDRKKAKKICNVTARLSETFSFNHRPISWYPHASACSFAVVWAAPLTYWMLSLFPCYRRWWCWSTQLDKSTGWCLLLISLSHSLDVVCERGVEQPG